MLNYAKPSPQDIIALVGEGEYNPHMYYRRTY